MKDKVLETVVNSIEFEFEKDILVKPLEVIKITKEFEEQIPNGKKDKNGFNKYDVKKTSKEVESDFRKGIVISLPTNEDTLKGIKAKLGDTVVYPSKFAKDFDLYKDSQLVKPYDVVAIVK